MIRKIYLLLFATVLITSCSSDDNDSGGGSIVGTWDAIEVNLGEAVDWNDDGTSSDNLMDEVECFASTATFTAEGAYSSVTTSMLFEVTETGFTITCDGFVPASGTYSVEGNTLTTIDEEEGDAEATFSISGNTLTVTGYVAAVDGVATLVFTKR